MFRCISTNGDMYVQNVFFAFFQLRLLTLHLCASLNYCSLKVNMGGDGRVLVVAVVAT